MTCGTQFYVTKKFGKIFKSNQIKSLTNAIRFFLENKENYQKFSLNSFIYATKNLSEKNYNNYLEKHVTTKKNRIIFFLPSFADGGAEENIISLANKYKSENENISFIVGNKTGLNKSKIDKKLN